VSGSPDLVSPPSPGPDTSTPDLDENSRKTRRGRRRDMIFFRFSGASAAFVLVLLVAIALFLLQQAIPAIKADTANFFTSTAWNPDAIPPVFGIAALLYGTLVTAVLALIMAFPVAMGVSLWLAIYAPRRLARPLGYVVDLLAAVPSVVFGLWGLIYLVPRMIPLSAWLSHYFGWIPIFASDGIYGRSLFTASVVLAIMVLPLIAAVSREVFLQVPAEQKEAALALGATRWEMIRVAVIPYGRPGIISAAVLGFGRAMGETIAIALVLSTNYEISAQILAPGGNTIAANIANTFGEAGTVGRGALIASGLVLFVITLGVNFAARAIVARRKDFQATSA
jgi:phosphate transport system permease protein